MLKDSNYLILSDEEEKNLFKRNKDIIPIKSLFIIERTLNTE
jgi:hypothetical protein